jgi:hypothetical protein
MTEKKTEDTREKNQDTMAFEKDDITGTMTLKDIFDDAGKAMTTPEEESYDNPEGAEVSDGSETSAVQTGEESESSPESETSRDEGSEEDNDKKRYEYWQSQYDKLKAEVESKKPELEQVEALNEAIKSDPQLLRMIQDYYTQPQNGVQPQADTRQPQKSELPEPPKKPDNYDPYEAYNEPESESYKYRTKHEKWMIEQAEQRAYQRSQEFYQKQLDFYARQQQEQLRKQKEQQVLNDFRMRHPDVPEEKFNDFLKWANDPKNMNFDNVWKLYDALTSDSKKQQSAEAAVAEKLRRTQSAPDSFAGVGSPEQPPTDPTDTLWSSIKKYGNVESPF